MIIFIRTISGNHQILDTKKKFQPGSRANQADNYYQAKMIA